jgi:transposase-like protein
MKGLEEIRKCLEVQGDLLRQMVQLVAEGLMSAEANAVCDADYGERSSERVNRRNGYRTRRWDTRVGTMDLRIPKLRQGSYFPHFLLEPRRRSERALVAVVVESYVLGVSTRKVERLVEAMGLGRISRSQVSELVKQLDEQVKAFRTRRLEGGPYPFVWLDALVMKVREDGRVVNTAVVVATGVSSEGRREILGMDLFTTEDEAAWTTFLRSLAERGLAGVQLIVSDAHRGLRNALERVFPGASWQRCRAHFLRNVLTCVPRSAQGMVGSLVRSVFSQDTPEAVRAQYRSVIEKLAARFPAAAELLEDAEEDILAFTAFPKAIWRQIWSNNPQERLNREIRRRTDVVGIFPNRDAALRLIGAILAEQNDEWLVARRYISLKTLEPVLAPPRTDPELPQPDTPHHQPLPVTA